MKLTPEEIKYVDELVFNFCIKHSEELEITETWGTDNNGFALTEYSYIRKKNHNRQKLNNEKKKFLEQKYQELTVPMYQYLMREMDKV